MKIHNSLKYALISLVVCCSFVSCVAINYIQLEHYRRKPKDPELIGEWFCKATAEEIKSNPKLIEKSMKKNESFYAGSVFHKNGYMEVIYLYYSKDTGEPYLKKGPGRSVFYTDKEKGIIYSMLTYRKPGDLNPLVAERYEIRGDKMCFARGEDWQPDHERRAIIADLFPKKQK